MPEEDSAILRMFSAGNGLYLGRNLNGDVRILKVNEQTHAPEADVIVDADTWVKAMTACAKDADTAETHFKVKELHLGEEAVDRG